MSGPQDSFTTANCKQKVENLLLKTSIPWLFGRNDHRSVPDLKDVTVKVIVNFSVNVAVVEVRYLVFSAAY